MPKNPHGCQHGKSPSKYSDYKGYIEAVESFRFDIVLVDGRARPQCAIHSLPYFKVRAHEVLG